MSLSQKVLKPPPCSQLRLCLPIQGKPEGSLSDGSSFFINVSVIVNKYACLAFITSKISSILYFNPLTFWYSIFVLLFWFSETFSFLSLSPRLWRRFKLLDFVIGIDLFLDLHSVNISSLMRTSYELYMELPSNQLFLHGLIPNMAVHMGRS